MISIFELSLIVEDIAMKKLLWNRLSKYISFHIILISRVLTILDRICYQQLQQMEVSKTLDYYHLMYLLDKKPL